jgi:hypothetical protein
MYPTNCYDLNQHLDQHCLLLVPLVAKEYTTVPLVAKEYTSIHLELVASLGGARTLFDTPKRALNSLEGFF